jgi:hypothetical protein
MALDFYPTENNMVIACSKADFNNIVKEISI